MLWQPPLDSKYTCMSDDDLVVALRQRRDQLGSQLVILGHHYQQDDVFRFADFTGDSFKLSQLAAERVQADGARYVVFCGVHFMAESADILTPEETTVILPDLSAGCSMADMADIEEAEEAWASIHESLERFDAGTSRVIPICYMNCSAAVKAFCGEHGGAVCTSSNCREVLQWALDGGTEPDRGGDMKILFLPDQHLGRNTAAAMGFDVDRETCVWDPKDDRMPGGCDPETLAASRVILWKGHCSVHKLFRPEHVDQVRSQWPDVQVIVHPECCREVVAKADRTGSTEGILKVVEQAEPGTRWAVGTEVHMVTRLARSAAERGVTVRMLSDCQCLCTTMYRIDMPHLLWVLDELSAGRVVNPIRVDPRVREGSLEALRRMLQLTGAGLPKNSPGVQATDKSPSRTPVVSTPTSSSPG